MGKCNAVFPYRSINATQRRYTANGEFWKMRKGRKLQKKGPESLKFFFLMMRETHP